MTVHHGSHTYIRIYIRTHICSLINSNLQLEQFRQDLHLVVVLVSLNTSSTEWYRIWAASGLPCVVCVWSTCDMSLPN